MILFYLDNFRTMFVYNYVIKGSKGIIDACLHACICKAQIRRSIIYAASFVAILSQRKARKPRPPRAYTCCPGSEQRSCLESVELCFDTQKCTGRDAGARSYRAMEGEQRRFRQPEKIYKHNSYRILTAQRSEQGSAWTLTVAATYMPSLAPQ